MWDLAVVPWMKTGALAQVVGRGIESYLLMDSASSGLVRASMEEGHRINVALASLLSPKVGQTPRTRIWTKNKAQLYRYDRPTQVPVQYRTPLLIVYALINKPYILDKKVSSTEKELVIVPGSHFALAVGQQGVRNL